MRTAQRRRRSRGQPHRPLGAWRARRQFTSSRSARAARTRTKASRRRTSSSTYRNSSRTPVGLREGGKNMMDREKARDINEAARSFAETLADGGGRFRPRGRAEPPARTRPGAKRWRIPRSPRAVGWAASCSSTSNAAPCRRSRPTDEVSPLLDTGPTRPKGRGSTGSRPFGDRGRGWTKTATTS